MVSVPLLLLDYKPIRSCCRGRSRWMMVCEFVARLAQHFWSSAACLLAGPTTLATGPKRHRFCRILECPPKPTVVPFVRGLDNQFLWYGPNSISGLFLFMIHQSSWGLRYNGWRDSFPVRRFVLKQCPAFCVVAFWTQAWGNFSSVLSCSTSTRTPQL